MKIRNILTALSLVVASCTALSSIGYANEQENDQSLVTITTPSQQIVTNDVEQYLNDNGLNYQDLFVTEKQGSDVNSSASNPIVYDSTSSMFINVTNECLWVVFAVTSGRGYYGVYSHRAEPFQPFGWPYYKDSKTSVTKRILTTMSCSNNPPGTVY